jgi:hypothetical protein
VNNTFLNFSYKISPNLGLEHITKILQKPELRDSFNRHLFEAAKFGPTIFPILFSAIVTQTLGSAARWKAERGTTLEVSMKILLHEKFLVC